LETVTVESVHCLSRVEQNVALHTCRDVVFLSHWFATKQYKLSLSCFGLFFKFYFTLSHICECPKQKKTVVPKTS